MPQTITTGYKALVDAAKSEITEYSVEQVVAMKDDPNVVIVDIRDPRELDRDGRISGAVHCPRGMLEFWIDPESPYHKAVFADDKQYIFFCAGGLRSALAAKTAQDMGLQPVAHMLGGFGAWKKSGAPVQTSKA
ncbi:MAG: rhodanese-like domain-containing protein [Hyphomicrobiaceae bacterium]